MQTLLRRVSAWFRRDRLDDDVAEEIHLHLELRRQALIDNGVAPADADREARRQFGNVTVIRERTRDQWVSPAAAALVQDLRFGSRLLARNPGLSAVVALTIALGAGLNSGLFLLLNNMLLGTGHIPDAGTAVWLDEGRPLQGPSYPDYVDYRDRTSAFSDLAAYASMGVVARLPGEDQPSSIRAVMASGNYFAVMQSGAALGRTLAPADDRPPFGNAVVVLSDAYWTRCFNRDPAAIGATLELNFKRFTVVGVLPPEFTGARSASGNPYVPAVWVPLWSVPLLEPEQYSLVERTTWWGLQAIGRLRDDVPLTQARAQVAAVASALDTAYPGQRRPRLPRVVRVTAFDPRAFMGEQGAVIALLGTASMCVLFIACANVAGLLLARASTRRREIAVRLSLGASRGRIIRQFITEGLVLAVIGTVIGYFAASLVLRVSLTAGAAQPLTWSFSPDARVLVFAGIAALVATISTGLMPALQASRTVLLPALQRSEGARIGRLRMVLVASEVAVSLVMLLATALLLRGLVRAQAIDPGLPVGHLLAVDVDARLHGYEGAAHESVMREVRRQIESLPGVESTTLVSPAPFSESRHGSIVRPADAPDSAPIGVMLARVSGSFLKTSGIPILRGRWFDEQIAEEIVINESLAARLSPSGDALGMRVTSGHFDRRSHVVVGIVRDTPYVSLRERNSPFLFERGTIGTVLVRTSGPAAAFARTATAAAERVDRRFRVTSRPLTDGIAGEFDMGRKITAAAGGFGALALLIALAGVAAMAAQSVAQRTHEIGVRMALGARRRDAVALILRRVMTPVGIGSMAGLAFALVVPRVLASQLYGLSPFDPIAFLGGIAFVMAAAAAAAWLPARRAATVDPVRALRSE